VLELMAERARFMATQPGFISVCLHRSEDGSHVVNYVQWTNREKLEAELADARQRYLRLAADFENFKKRARQDQLDTIQHASADLISRLLPVLDDLRSALEHKPEGVDEAWAKGIELSVRKLEDVMSTHGLEPIPSVGSRFDPRYHEAIGHVESDEHPEDTVVTELRRGYRIRDRVVRPSLVKVSRRPELPSAGAATPSS